VLRAGLYPGTPNIDLPDSGSGGPRGVGYDLGKELARRLAFPSCHRVYEKTPRLRRQKAAKSNVAFTNRRRVRARDMDSARLLESSSAISSRRLRAGDAAEWMHRDAAA